MSGLRHNPYVGSFHNVKLQAENGGINCKDFMAESKNNPLVGVFRHSPSAVTGRLGLKGVITEKSVVPPVISQLQISKENQVTLTPPSLTQLHSSEMNAHRSALRPQVTAHGRSFVTSWRQIPLVKYESSTAESINKSAISSVVGRGDSPPVCSICIEPYADGDQLKTLACSHIFHTCCVGKWWFQACLNEEESSFDCPECRQEHFRRRQQPNETQPEPQQLQDEKSIAETSEPETASCSNQIAGDSFLSMGNYLLESNYDLISDVDVVVARDLFATASPCRSKPQTQSEVEVNCSRSDTEEIDPTDEDACALQLTDLSISLHRENSNSVSVDDSSYSDCGGSN
jgi:hypothetical protein